MPMRSLRVIVGAIWIAILLVTHGIWTATALPLDVVSAFPDPSTTSVRDGAENDDYSASSAPRLYDMYGNEIEEALGDYRIDVRGEMYERHAPQTALPEPAKPST
jgi:FtsZ-interacting cell division protein ZipA